MSEYSGIMFLPDVVLTADTTAVLSRTDGTSATVAMRSGSWFASGLHMLAHIVDTYNTTGNGGGAVSNTIALTMVHEGSKDADNGKGKMTWSGGNTLTLAWSANATEATAVTGQGVFSSQASPVAADFAPFNELELTFPPVTYSIGSMPRGAAMQAAADSTLYSIQGSVQRTVSMSVNIDIGSGYNAGEYEGWLTLFKSYWFGGRSVLTLVDPVSYAATTLVSSGVGKAHSLVSLENADITFSRLVESKETYSVSGPFGYGIRMARPLSDGEGQAKLVVT